MVRARAAVGLELRVMVVLIGTHRRDSLFYGSDVFFAHQRRVYDTGSGPPTQQPPWAPPGEQFLSVAMGGIRSPVGRDRLTTLTLVAIGT